MHVKITPKEVNILMNVPSEYYILAFETTTNAMQAEKLLKDIFDIAIMPVPREISSGCGLAIRFQNPDEHAIIEHMKTVSLEGTLYKLCTKKVNGKRHVDKLFPTD